MFLMVAGTFGAHWQLQPDEAIRLNTAINNVCRHFAVFETEKSRDIGALMVVAAQIAGPRAYLTVTNRRPATAPQPQAQPATANGAGPLPPIIPQGAQTPSQADPLATFHGQAGSA